MNRSIESHWIDPILIKISVTDQNEYNYTYDFVVLTCLTHPRKILLVVLQIGKAEDLSAALRNLVERYQFFRINNCLEG
jgi:hypothetical protein